MIQLNDTIAAIATPSGGGISIVRISGPNAVEIIKKVFTQGVTESHKVYYGFVRDGGEIIDEALVTVMCAPKSYTAEDVAEISCHGGVASVRRVLGTVLRNGARLAQPGEFTKRAFLNGRIDLSQAEAVSALINAQTALSQKAALRQLRGGLSARVKKAADKLLSVMAHIEANIDYPEHDEGMLSYEAIMNGVSGVIADVEALLATADSGRIIRDGLETVIIGRPNVGKSSLLNALLDEQRAIVTDIAGTTRDVLREFICLGDIPLKISDTAGIRETGDAVEQIGVERSVNAARGADLLLLVVDSRDGVTNEDLLILDEYAAGCKTLALINKSDLNGAADVCALNERIGAENVIRVSAKTGEGLDELKRRVKDMFFAGEIDYENTELITSARHTAALSSALAALRNALATADAGLPQDFVSIDLFSAYNSLGEITGETTDEDLVDKIFSEFCLGK